MGRPPCCDKLNVKRGLWTAEEDAKILAYVATHGIGNWTLVPKKAGLNRCGKSCRLRWTNYLRPDLNHNNFTPQEEDLILRLHRAIGSRWSLIAKQLGGRTDNDVKNYWNTKLRKKLTKMEIDPVTHKPFSQIISDLGNIGASTNPISAPPPQYSTPPRESNAGRGNVPPQESSHRWSDFLSEGDFIFSDAQCQLRGEDFGSEFAIGNGGGDEAETDATPSSLMSSSFVNEILDWDSQMQMEFTDVCMEDEMFYC